MTFLALVTAMGNTCCCCSSSDQKYKPGKFSALNRSKVVVCDIYHLGHSVCRCLVKRCSYSRSQIHIQESTFLQGGSVKSYVQKFIDRLETSFGPLGHHQLIAWWSPVDRLGFDEFEC